LSLIWNNHKLRTEHNRTPIQLYADRNPESLWIPQRLDDLQYYGVDWNGPVPIAAEDEEEFAVVEPPDNPLSDLDWEILSHQFQSILYPEVETLANNCISPQFRYATDMYLEVRQWIGLRILHYNNDN